MWLSTQNAPDVEGQLCFHVASGSSVPTLSSPGPSTTIHFTHGLCRDGVGCVTALPVPTDQELALWYRPSGAGFREGLEV